jgi:hypothetical protein
LQSRGLAVFGAGAASGAAAQLLACSLLLAVGPKDDFPRPEHATPFLSILIVAGAVVGGPVALLGERIFLRPLPIDALLEAWPKLMCMAIASAIATTFGLLFLAWAVNSMVFLAGCAAIRWRWERCTARP